MRKTKYTVAGFEDGVAHVRRDTGGLLLWKQCLADSQQGRWALRPIAAQNRNLLSTWMRQEVDSFPEPLDNCLAWSRPWHQLWDSLNLELSWEHRLPTLTDFRATGLWANKWVLFETTKFVIVCVCSNRKWIHLTYLGEKKNYATFVD